MTTSTETIPESIVDLDWDPQCSSGNGGIRCPQQADWVAAVFCPVCTKDWEGLICESHRSWGEFYGVWICRGCRGEVAYDHTRLLPI
jgi:hypothetical protein